MKHIDALTEATNDAKRSIEAIIREYGEDIDKGYLGAHKQLSFSGDMLILKDGELDLLSYVPTRRNFALFADRLEAEYPSFTATIRLADKPSNPRLDADSIIYWNNTRYRPDPSVPDRHRKFMTADAGGSPYFITLYRTEGLGYTSDHEQGRDILGTMVANKSLVDTMKGDRLKVIEELERELNLLNHFARRTMFDVFIYKNGELIDEILAVPGTEEADQVALETLASYKELEHKRRINNEHAKSHTDNT